MPPAYDQLNLGNLFQSNSDNRNISTFTLDNELPPPYRIATEKKN